MRYRKGKITAIVIPPLQWSEIVSHCRRKLQGEYLCGEGHSPKAFGLIGGTLSGEKLVAQLVIPLLKNARECGEAKVAMDNAMEQHGTPSETPFDQRGWVAEQEELDKALLMLSKSNLRLIGNYHMHRVAWEDDPVRDTPTKLDKVLGSGSRMFMFIVSMVNPEYPLVRAFYEGSKDIEVTVEIN